MDEKFEYALNIVAETESTNDDIERLLSSDIAGGSFKFHGYSERAVIQTKGHGRFDRKWNSSYGGLYQSVLLFLEKLGGLSLNKIIIIVAYCIRQSIFEFLNGSCDVRIKWPNDIIVNGRKICGILIKAIFGANMTSLIIGFGVNVFNAVDKNSLRQGSVLTPCNLAEFCGRNLCESDITAISNLILSKMKSSFIYAINGGYDEIFKKYNDSLLYIGEKVELFGFIEDEVPSASGIFRALDENGFLLIENEKTGAVSSWASGEIRCVAESSHNRVINTNGPKMV